MAKKKLKVIPLGGLGQIGKNMMVLEYADQMLVIDAGLMFPENEMLGIDIVIPDMSYVLERKDKVLAVIVTHGHEDHIGALPYLLSQIKVPVYATRLTQGLIEVKLRESRVSDVEQHIIRPGDVLTLGPFNIEFFHVSHSIPDGVGLAIQTEVGLVMHSGDFKFDHSPVDGQPTDFAKLAELGKKGVLLLLSDSTNAETPGYTPSETKLARIFESVFSRARGRIIVATFASNISRIQQVISTAQQYGRYVAVAGRSMSNNVRMAMDLGYLQVPDGVLLSIDEIQNLPQNQVAIVCTGSQGEPTSALVRMARNEYAPISLLPGDTVIVSATPIPGNEELVNRTINNLFRLGAEVFYDELLDVHVSGHGCQEELKLMLNMTRPKFFVPIHGEYRHLVLHARLAEEVGILRQNIFVLESGQMLELDQNSAQIAGTVSDEYVLVDGLGVGDITEVVLEDRRLLSRNGFLVVTLVIERGTGRILSGPEIVSRGFVYVRESEDLFERVRTEVLKAAKEGGNRILLGNRIKDALTRFIYNETRRRPLILPVVMEV
ncbi:MAG: ribonuclease J [Chloroflexi bacterium]|nr:ribonuclease J [Chloroflexota bacterium]